jgi:hypothetical protein
VVALMLPSVALGQSSTCQAYNPQLCETSSGTTTTQPTSTGTLPFTGLDVALLAAGGATLLGAGFVVRRLSRRPN